MDEKKDILKEKEIRLQFFTSEAKNQKQIWMKRINELINEAKTGKEESWIIIKNIAYIFQSPCWEFLDQKEKEALLKIDKEILDNAKKEILNNLEKAKENETYVYRAIIGLTSLYSSPFWKNLETEEKRKLLNSGKEILDNFFLEMEKTLKNFTPTQWSAHDLFTDLNALIPFINEKIIDKKTIKERIDSITKGQKDDYQKKIMDKIEIDFENGKNDPRISLSALSELTSFLKVKENDLL